MASSLRTEKIAPFYLSKHLLLLSSLESLNYFPSPNRERESLKWIVSFDSEKEDDGKNAPIEGNKVERKGGPFNNLSIPIRNGDQGASIRSSTWRRYIFVRAEKKKEREETSLDRHRHSASVKRIQSVQHQQEVLRKLLIWLGQFETAAKPRWMGRRLEEEKIKWNKKSQSE